MEHVGTVYSSIALLIPYDLQLTVLEGFANSLLEKSVMSMCVVRAIVSVRVYGCCQILFC